MLILLVESNFNILHYHSVTRVLLPCYQVQQLARETLVLLLEFNPDISCYSRITPVLPGAAAGAGDAGAAAGV